MKRFIVLASVFCLLSVGTFAQIPDYSGKWTLDKSLSKLSARMAAIESMTITVTQTGTELKAVTVSKRMFVPQEASGEELVIYDLNGKENKTDINMSNVTGIVKSRAKFESGKLSLKAERTFKTQMGDLTATTRETWELSADGATLKVKRETETPQEKISAELVFTKKTDVAAITK